MSFDLDLTNRRALITGGIKGVGAAVVETLRDAGAQVVTSARSIPARRTEGVRYIAADLSTLEGASFVRQRLGPRGESFVAVGSNACAGLCLFKQRIWNDPLGLDDDRAGITMCP
jgi:NAD(P)-dependent dehydrogenase (short-subunit alcohol dehydrogenase family)